MKIGGNEVGRLTLQPGWRWSDCIKPVVGGDRSRADHVGYAVSVRVHVEHDDGTTGEIWPRVQERSRVAKG